MNETIRKLFEINFLPGDEHKIELIVGVWFLRKLWLILG
jgi:hypothetical protein